MQEQQKANGASAKADQPVDQDEVLLKVLGTGDLSGLTFKERKEYILMLCQSLGLNPMTRPLQITEIDGKTVLYATKDCTEQLRKLHVVSVKILGRATENDIHIVTAQASMQNGRVDESIGAIALSKADGEWVTPQNGGKRFFRTNGKMITLSGVDRANALMKCECVPLNSEILTRSGWRKYNEIEVADEVLAYNCATDETVWTPLLAVTVHDQVPMSRLFSDRGQFEVFCTPNHSWAVVKDSYAPSKPTGKPRGPHGPYASRKADRRLVKASDINTSLKLILAAPERSSVMPSALTPVEAAIMGWAVTDGTIQQRGAFRRVGICQSKEENFEAIRDLVEVVSPGCREIVSRAGERTFPMSGRTYATKEQHWWYLPSAVGKDLLSKAGFEGKGRECLPNLATRLSPMARKAMLQAMMLAEGDKRHRFANTDRDILDAFQILCTLEGIAVGQEKGKSDNCRTIRKKLTRHVAGAFLNIEDAGWAPAWCPTTEFGTWVMRQNGRVMITGNTKAKRRVTLSICGLGIPDESELEDIREASAIAMGLYDGPRDDNQNVDDIAENDPALKIAVKSIEAQATGNVINMPTGAKQPEPTQTALPPRDAKLEEFFEKPVTMPSPTIFHRPPTPPPAPAAATETGVTDDDLPEENGTRSHDPARDAHEAFMGRFHEFCKNHEIANEKAVMTWLIDDAGTAKEPRAEKRAELINQSFAKLNELVETDPSIVEGFKKTKAAAKAKAEGKPDPIAEEFPKWGPETCDQARKVMATHRMTAGKFLDVLKSNGFKDMPEEEAKVGLELYGRHLGLLMGVKMAWQKNVAPSKLKQLLNFHCPDGKSLDKCEPGEMMSAMAGAMGELQ